jgi:peptide/nickel transport system substrate-binding protein
MSEEAPTSVERFPELRASRRQALKLGLWLAASAYGGLAVACRPAAQPGSTVAPARPTEAAKPAAPTAAPTVTASRGVGGTLKMLLWQAPTIVNPHQAQGTKDYIASRCCLEPLLTVDGEGKLEPVLAAQVPSRENGGLSADGKTVVYELKKDVKWADGKPFTAEDVVFTYQYIVDKETSATTLSQYLPLDKVEALDATTVKLTFKDPTAGWYVPFVGGNGMVVPKHILSDFVGANARNAPFNLKSFGTGPYVVEDFRPGDLVTYAVNPNYRDPAKPFFNRIELKGGGDAVSAARAVFETAEFDYAWNLQVEWPVLQQIMQGGKGDLVTAPGSGVEQLWLNQTDPNKEVDGERSHLSTQHPFLSETTVRHAMALAVDRETIAKQLYGPTGEPTSNSLTTPTTIKSPNTSYEFNIEKANKVLDEAGYRRGGDGIRVTPAGVRMKLLYTTAINSLRQKEQAVVKDGWQKIGIEVELKSIDAGVYFSSAPGNTDTYAHFYADVEMTTTTYDSPFPAGYMSRWYARDPARDIAQKSNNWAGRNFVRWLSTPEYNQLYEQATVEQDPEKNRQIWIRMNDIVASSYISIPLVDRKFTSGKARGLHGPAPRAFDRETWNIADWTKG